MAFNFEKYTQDANDFIKQLAFELGAPENTRHAARVIESFFHTLRERITPEESMHFVSQLPMYLKAVYINDWKIGSALKKYKTREEFLDSLRIHTNRTAAVDFPTDEEADKKLVAVISVLKRYITEGEMNHIMAQLPFDIVTTR